MTEDKFISKLVKLAQEFESKAQYVECHNFTDNTARQHTDVHDNSSVSYREAANSLYKLVAEYMLDNKCSYKSSSNRVNYFIKLRQNRVTTL